MRNEPVWSWLFAVVAVGVYALLLLSIGLSYVELGVWSTVIAIGIATIQAGLVAWYSMELFASRLSIKIIAFIAPLFVVLLVAFAAMDPMTRQPQPILIPEINLEPLQSENLEE